MGIGMGSLAERHGNYAVHLFPAGRRARFNPITGEITYGIERIAMYLQDKDNVFDLVWTAWQENGVERVLCYGDVYRQNEIEQSAYNFEQSNAPKLTELFGFFESEAKRLIDAKLPLPG